MKWTSTLWVLCGYKILFIRVNKWYTVIHGAQISLGVIQRSVVCWHLALPRVQLEVFPRSCGWALLLHLCLCIGKERLKRWSLSLMARSVPMACLIATPSRSQLVIGICSLKLPRYSNTLLEFTGSSPSLCTAHCSVLSPHSVAVLKMCSTYLIHPRNTYHSGTQLILASLPQLKRQTFEQVQNLNRKFKSLVVFWTSCSKV